MNSSPRSDSSRRTQDTRSALGGPLSGAAAMLALGLTLGALTGCSDDLASPTQGTVRIQLTAGTAGAAEGARIYEGDGLLHEFDQEEQFELRLPAGAHTLRIEKACSSFLPQSTLEVQVVAGADQTVGWAVEPSGGVEVRSSIAGAEIFLDGASTGKVTPATLACVAQGTHTVGISIVGGTPEAPKTIEVADATQTVDFSITPTPQQRGVLLELCTATFCPNCPPADAACNQLTRDTSLPAERFSAVECHSRWGGTDIFATPSTIARDITLGGERNGNPFAAINGLAGFRGAGDGNVENLAARYRELISAYLEQPGKVALHLLGSSYVPGQSIRADVRMFLLDSPDSLGASDRADLEVTAAYYKNELNFDYPGRGPTTYYHVVRAYQPIATFADLSLTEQHPFADVAVQFDLSGDTNFPEQGMALVVFVQNKSTREILQVLHREISAAP
ncbi:MAG: PEGA domain-containing protein [Candidatus Eisenbacteria bacterium]